MSPILALIQSLVSPIPSQQQRDLAQTYFLRGAVH